MVQARATDPKRSLRRTAHYLLPWQSGEGLTRQPVMLAVLCNLEHRSGASAVRKLVIVSHLDPACSR